MNQEPMLPEEQEEPIGAIEVTEEAPKKNKKRDGFVASLFDVVEMFAWSVLAVLIVFSFFFRLCRVDGRSMENTLYNEQTLLLSSFAYEPRQDDIIVFHLTDPDHGLEKTLVKRVIATEGQTVVIDFRNAELTVDGIKYEDSHAVLKNLNNRDVGVYLLTAEHHYDPEEGIFEATVPEGHVFVLGDNRNNSKDSRDSDVGFIDQRCILGKAILRLSPFTVFS